MDDDITDMPSPSQEEPKPARRPGLLAKLGLSAASLFVFLFLSEVVLKLMGYGRVEIYEPDPKLYWRLKPGQTCLTKVDRKPVRINSRGARGAEFEIPKPPGTIRILSLGDSSTFGWGLAEEETYSHLLQAGLQERAGAGRRIEVVNAGVNAWSYPQIKVFLREHGLGFQPDFALLASANLWTQFSEDSDPKFVEKMMSRVRLKNLLRRSAIYHFVIEVQLAHIYQRYRTRFIPVDPKQDALFKEAQKSDPDAVFRGAIEDFCKIARERGVKPVVVFVPVLTDLKEGRESNVQRVKREICQRLAVPLVDVTDDLKADADSYYLEGDPVHLNARGNAVVARRLVDVFAGLLAK